MKDTIEVEKGWFRRLFELIDDMTNTDDFTEKIHKLTHIIGYIDSMRESTKK